MQAKNPTYTVDNGIDLMVLHPEFGWIPFTARPDDVEPHGVELYNNAISGKYGDIAPYVAPPPLVPQVVSRVQFKLALDSIGVLDSVINTMKTADLKYRMSWDELQHFSRKSQLIQFIMHSHNINESDMDALFFKSVEFVL